MGIDERTPGLGPGSFGGGSICMDCQICGGQTSGVPLVCTKRHGFSGAFLLMSFGGGVYFMGAALAPSYRAYIPEFSPSL